MENFLLISNIILWVVVLLNLLLTLAIIRQMNQQSDKASSSFHKVIELEVGQPAPAFQAPLISGETISLQNYQGRKTLFLFAGPHCKACREILPGLISWIAQAEQAGHSVVLVSDAPANDTKAFLADLGLRIPAMIVPRGSNPLLDDYKVIGTPSFCSIDEQGVIHSAGYPSLEWGELKQAFD